MQVLPLGRSRLAQTATVSLLTLAAVALLGLVLAYWTWIWFAPRAEPRAELAVPESGTLASASLVFGRAEVNKNVAAPTAIAIRLLGVAAATGGRRGTAVVQLESKQILAVLEGEEVTPGVRLAEVHPENVILERGGIRETLTWPQRKGGPSPAPQADQSAAARAAEAAAQQAAERVAPRATQQAAPPPTSGGSSRRRRSSSSDEDE